MFDTKAMLKRQADWQHKQARLSWAQKLRMAEQVRDGIETLRATAKPTTRPSALPHVAEDHEPYGSP